MVLIFQFLPVSALIEIESGIAVVTKNAVILYHRHQRSDHGVHPDGQSLGHGPEAHQGEEFEPLPDITCPFQRYHCIFRKATLWS